MQHLHRFVFVSGYNLNDVLNVVPSDENTAEN